MIKYIRETSDIHLNFFADVWNELPNYHHDRIARVPEAKYLWYPEPLPTDSETALVLAGDLWEADRPFERRFAGPDSWIERVAAQFAAVIIVPGNHDFWRTSLQRWYEKAQLFIEHYGLKNVHILNDTSVVVGDVKFLGNTLWTDYNRQSPLLMFRIPDMMQNDYKLIKTRVGTDGTGYVYRRLWTRDVIAMHLRSREFIFENARRDHPDQKVVVVTHHAPSYQSIGEEFKTSTSADHNFCYFSDLDYYMYDEAFQADLWFHGHVHEAKDYMIDRTRVICNPLGYHGYEAPQSVGHNPTLLLEVAQLPGQPLSIDYGDDACQENQF